MKKTLLLFTLFGSLNFYGQSLLNPGFENWDAASYGEPDNWYTANAEVFPYFGIANVSKVQGHTGFGIRIETTLSGDDTLKAYISNTMGDVTAGEGGVPFSQLPTHITGYYRYNLPANDTAIMLVIFKKLGTVISMDMIKVKGTGSQSTFTSFSYPVTVPMTPDSVVIAIASSNLISEQGIEPGSFIEIDGLGFSGSGVTQTLPNNQFENWTTHTTEWLFDWETQGEGVSKTTDSYDGTYAARIETMNYGQQQAYGSGITSGYFGMQGPEGGQPFTNLVDTLTGYYKYVTTGMDSAVVAVSVSANSTSVGGGLTFLHAAANYTYFEVPISTSSAPDTIRVDAYSSDYTSAIAGSVLYLDKLQIKSQGISTSIKMVDSGLANSVYPNPASDVIYINTKAFNGTSFDLVVSDITGKVVKKETYNGSSTLVQLKIDELAQGVYSYELNNGREVVRNKFVKK